MKSPVTFCNVPYATNFDTKNVNVAVIGVPSSAGSAWSGTEHGPYFIRTISQQFLWGASSPAVIDVAERTPVGLSSVVDLGDINVSKVNNALEVTTALRSQVKSLPPGVIPGILGGDHSLTLGAIQALCERYPDLHVVQFDHHLDVQIWRDPAILEDLFNTNVMSHVAAELGYGRCTQVGVGEYAVAESPDAQRALEEFRRVGTQIPLSRTMLDGALSNSIGVGKPLYLSVDVDVIDCSEMSSTSYPAVAGISTRELLALIDSALENNRLIGFDVVEFAAERHDRSPATLADAARVSLVFMHLLKHAAKSAPHPADSSS